MSWPILLFYWLLSGFIGWWIIWTIDYYEDKVDWPARIHWRKRCPSPKELWKSFFYSFLGLFFLALLILLIGTIFTRRLRHSKWWNNPICGEE